MNRLLVPLLVAAAFGGLAIGSWRPAAVEAEPLTLPAAVAIGGRVDTLLLGGYARGTFPEAVRALGPRLSPAERALLGQHLGDIFGPLAPRLTEQPGGRLRVVYERVLGPRDSVRSVRVLGAELAVAGRLHTAFYFEGRGRSGFFDHLGRPLDSGRGWRAPLSEYRVSSGFGAARLHPILNRVLPHTGMDLAAPSGSPVAATADGVVVFAGSRGGYGLLVEVRHANGYTTRYAHLSRIADGIGPESLVRRGDVIGYVGMSGLATGPHLHYELHRLGRPIDPARAAYDASTFADDIATTPEWLSERKRVGQLIASVPTIVEGTGGDSSDREPPG